MRQSYVDKSYTNSSNQLINRFFWLRSVVLYTIHATFDNKPGNLQELYLSCQGSRHRVDETLHPVFNGDFRVVEEVVDGIHSTTDVVLVRVEGMPVVHVIELQMDAVVVVVTGSKQEIRFVDKLEVVVGQMVDVVFNHNFDQLTL